MILHPLKGQAYTYVGVEQEIMDTFEEQQIWRLVATQLASRRSAGACMSRWLNHLRPSLKPHSSGQPVSWTQSEEDQLRLVAESYEERNVSRQSRPLRRLCILVSFKSPTLRSCSCSGRKSPRSWTLAIHLRPAWPATGSSSDRSSRSLGLKKRLRVCASALHSTRAKGLSGRLALLLAYVGPCA